MQTKGKKVYAAFTGLEKPYDRIDWIAMWAVLKVYGVSGRLMNGVKAFHKSAKACIKVNGDTVLTDSKCVFSARFNLYTRNEKNNKI